MPDEDARLIIKDDRGNRIVIHGDRYKDKELLHAFLNNFLERLGMPLQVVDDTDIDTGTPGDVENTPTGTTISPGPEEDPEEELEDDESDEADTASDDDLEEADDPDHTCDDCGEDFRGEHGLNIHQSRSDCGQEEENECLHCGKIFGKKYKKYPSMHDCDAKDDDIDEGEGSGSADVDEDSPTSDSTPAAQDPDPEPGEEPEKYTCRKCGDEFDKSWKAYPPQHDCPELEEEETVEPGVAVPPEDLPLPESDAPKAEDITSLTHHGRIQYYVCDECMRLFDNDKQAVHHRDTHNHTKWRGYKENPLTDPNHAEAEHPDIDGRIQNLPVKEWPEPDRAGSLDTVADDPSIRFWVCLGHEGTDGKPIFRGLEPPRDHVDNEHIGETPSWYGYYQDPRKAIRPC